MTRHSKKPQQVFDVPGAPLEIRCAWQPNNNWCVTSTALTSKLWLVFEDDNGKWQVRDVADIGDPASIPLPIDISISSDDRKLWVNTFMDGKTRLFDMTDPFNPTQVYEKPLMHLMGPSIDLFGLMNNTIKLPLFITSRLNTDIVFGVSPIDTNECRKFRTR